VKIRADFVTNSSSSSYTTISIYTTDGREYSFDVYETGEEATLPKKRKNGSIWHNGEEVKSVFDLAIGLYAEISGDDDWAEGASAVAFLLREGTLKPKEILERLSSEERTSLADWWEGETDEPFTIDDLEDCDDETLDEILNQYAEESEMADEDDDNDAYSSVSEVVTKIKSLSDIDRIEQHYAEWLGNDSRDSLYEKLENMLKNEHFSAVSQSEPEYQDVLKRWVNILKNKILLDSSYEGYELQSGSEEELVAAALASGNPEDMIPESIMYMKNEVAYLKGNAEPDDDDGDDDEEENDWDDGVDGENDDACCLLGIDATARKEYEMWRLYDSVS